MNNNIPKSIQYFENTYTKPLDVNIFDIYNKIDYGYIKESLKDCITKDINLNITKIAKLIHFNEDHPENHNIYADLLGNKTIMIYDGYGFYESSYECEDILYYLTKITNRYIEQYECLDLYDEYRQGSNKKKKKMLDEIFQVYFNNRHITKKTHNLSV